MCRYVWVLGVCVYGCVCDEGAGARGDGWRGAISNYRVCTTKSPERRREERRRRREKALPLSAELSIAEREDEERGRCQLTGCGAVHPPMAYSTVKTYE